MINNTVDYKTQSQIKISKILDYNPNTQKWSNKNKEMKTNKQELITFSDKKDDENRDPQNQIPPKDKTVNTVWQDNDKDLMEMEIFAGRPSVNASQVGIRRPTTTKNIA